MTDASLQEKAVTTPRTSRTSTPELEGLPIGAEARRIAWHTDAVPTPLAKRLVALPSGRRIGPLRPMFQYKDPAAGREIKKMVVYGSLSEVGAHRNRWRQVSRAGVRATLASGCGSAPPPSSRSRARAIWRTSASPFPERPARHRRPRRSNRAGSSVPCYCSRTRADADRAQQLTLGACTSRSRNASAGDCDAARREHSQSTERLPAPRAQGAPWNQRRLLTPITSQPESAPSFIARRYSAHGSNPGPPRASEPNVRPSPRTGHHRSLREQPDAAHNPPRQTPSHDRAPT